MRHYEATIVLDPRLAEEGHGRQIEKIVTIIEKGGGANISEDRWGVRTLAYPINKNDQGFYTILRWEGAGEMIAELDQQLRLDENIMRHLIIHLDSTALAAMEKMRQFEAVESSDDSGDDDVAAGDDDDDDEGEEDDGSTSAASDDVDPSEDSEETEAGDDEASSDEGESESESEESGEQSDGDDTLDEAESAEDAEEEK